MRLEQAIATAMAERADDLRAVYREVEAKHGHKSSWQVWGKYDGLLARRYSKVLAPRVAELLAGAD